jgi:hypothetical protein
MVVIDEIKFPCFLNTVSISGIPMPWAVAAIRCRPTNPTQFIHFSETFFLKPIHAEQ